jgi:hypothetical protein
MTMHTTFCPMDDHVAAHPSFRLPDLTAEQRLAGAVIAQAVFDARGGRATAERARALLFLRADSPALRFWCDIGGLDARMVARLAADALAEPVRPRMRRRTPRPRGSMYGTYAR